MSHHIIFGINQEQIRFSSLPYISLKVFNQLQIVALQLMFYFNFKLEAMEAAVKLFIKYFPNTPVYPAMGNHESAPVNRLVTHD